MDSVSQLGDGHYYTWLQDEDGIFGLIEYHLVDDGVCGGWVAWKTPASEAVEPAHTLDAGGPDDPDVLTVSPSLLCRKCGSHGYIREGEWVAA